MAGGRGLLVTGGAGFIGGAVVRAALGAGWFVRVLDSLRADVHGAAPELPDGVDVVRADVRDAHAVAAALDGIVAVSHQAAKVGLGVDFADAPDYVASNDLGTAVLLAAMTSAGVDRLVLASSMVVYGEGAYTLRGRAVAVPPRRPEDLDAGRFEPVDPESGEDLTPGLVDEDAPLDPRNVYAATKVQQEHLAAAWARATGGRVAALRYHNVYGPGMPQNTPYAGVASLFRSQLERGEAPTVLEDGRQRRDFVHVRDVASANVAALGWTGQQQPGTVRAFNVGSGQVHTIHELAAALSDARGGPAPVVTGGYRLGDVRHVTASSARLRAELGVPPAVPFTDGVAEFATAPLRAAVRGGRVDVVLPCLDEALALPGVLARIPAGYRAIVVDNGSTDGSAEIAARHGAQVVREPRRGFGAAVHAGIAAATADLVAVLDADGSLDPADLPPLVALVGGGDADLVLGRRRTVGRGAWPLHARLANRVLARRIRTLTGLEVRDLGPMRVFRREPMLALGLVDRRSGYPLEMLLAASAAGWRIVERPVPYRPRSGRSKVTGTVRGTLTAIQDMRRLLAAHRAGVRPAPKA